MKIYNTLTKKKETLETKDNKNVSFFVCGPTVYDYPHIGHARTYVSFDAFVKFLRKTYDVFYLQNITDIDDKIIKRAQEKNENPSTLATRFEKEYMEDMKLLKINSVSKYARATDHIEEIISQIERLLEKEFAYHTDDGIYYDISKFKNYGKLSGRTTEQAEDGTSRIDESVKKRNKGDFCLWKFSKENEPQWESPWGVGRPGWHIEDTAIAEKFFGSQYDIHGGARDLIFPHHEAEVAQMEAISGKTPFVKYWIHTGFLTIKGEKMSKSLNNFITIRDFTEKHSPRILRFLILKYHYRSPVDYDEEKIGQLYRELEKIDQFLSDINTAEKNSTPQAGIEKIIEEYEIKINEALGDDFNTPVAIASLFSFITEINPKIKELSPSDVEKIITFLQEIDTIFGFIFATEAEKTVCYEEIENLPKDVQEMIAEREKVRERKEFQKADEIRKKIMEKGYSIEDTGKEVKIKKIKNI